MTITKPKYYDSFRCLAGNCPDSCCHQWAVVVDDVSQARYQALEGPLGQDLRSAMAEDDGEIILSLRPDGRCHMWRDDGLCRIQAELGEDALCETCRLFPRLRHDYGSFVEQGLELSCPEAARLILDGNAETITQTVPGGEEPDYDLQTMSILRDSRKQACALLADTTFAVEDALAILLLYGYAVQEQLDGGANAELHPQQDLAAARSLPLSPTGDILDFCKTLNILTPRWLDRLSNPACGAWSDKYRALSRYFIDRYWLQAVSDGDLMSRVKLILFSCLVIRELGGNLCQAAQLYSKEIENDADNIDTILDAAYTHSALSDANLLYRLLN